MKSRHFQSIIIMMLERLLQQSLLVPTYIQSFYSSRLKYSICNNEHHFYNFIYWTENKLMKRFSMDICNKCIPYVYHAPCVRETRESYLHNEYEEKT